MLMNDTLIDVTQQALANALKYRLFFVQYDSKTHL